MLTQKESFKAVEQVTTSLLQSTDPSFLGMTSEKRCSTSQVVEVSGRESGSEALCGGCSPTLGEVRAGPPFYTPAPYCKALHT